MKKINIAYHLNNMMDKLAEDYHVVFFIGVMFILSGILSLINKIIEDLIGIKIEFFHGTIFLGIFNICMSLVFLFNGIKSIKSIKVAEKTMKENTLSIAQRIELIEKEINELKANL